MPKQFINYAFGGTNKWNLSGMSQAHQKLVQEEGLNDTQFDTIVELFRETLIEMDIDMELIEEVTVIIECMRDSVLYR